MIFLGAAFASMNSIKLIAKWFLDSIISVALSN